MCCEKNIKEKLLAIKTGYEDAIQSKGKNTNNLIRTKKLINHLHEFIKEEFIRNGVSPDKIYPKKGDSAGEKKFLGYLKSKKQDISVIPKQPTGPIESPLGPTYGIKDEIGKELMEKSITVNVRSQLSSIKKNTDTLFERTYAEALNLHMKANRMVLGDLYLIPRYPWNQSKFQENRVEFLEEFPHALIQMFNSLNDRFHSTDAHYKYERVVLLIVDFKNENPWVMSKNDLIKAGLIPTEMKDIIDENLFQPCRLIPDLLNLYRRRHGNINDLV
ncbi:conserved hypothetical protein [Nitrosopumilaceae archaeon]|nr:hypothetical protein [Nitrosopumilus sp.]MDA7944968.1 hypothetical protein [Nitrosopumilus sp.]MDA7973775.1 hypothetical protein [Nitrosopumilus sp.]CAI9831009.1 conserved hypothetical protein [Nitrosopumilaceae archaeon]